MTPDRKEASSTPWRSPASVWPRATDDESSRLCGTDVVAISASEISVEPSGIVGTRPSATRGGRPVPPSVAAKHAIMKATTTESIIPMRSLEPPRSSAQHSGPSSTLIAAWPAGSGTTRRTASIVPEKLLHSYAKPPTTTKSASACRARAAHPAGDIARTASPSDAPPTSVSRPAPS